MTNPPAPDDVLPGPHPTQQAFPPLPLCWAALTDPERDQQRDILHEWVDWLVHRYALDHPAVPPCWPHHGALLEELSALRTAWLTAYAATSHGDAPLDWHTQFAATRQRLTDWVTRTGCRPGEHRKHG